MKFYLILELVAALCSVAVILVEGAVFGFVHIGTMGKGIRPSEVMLVCDGVENLCPSDCQGCVVFKFPVDGLP